MEKYMGNKSKFCERIYDEINNVYPLHHSMSFFDPFSGTTNVSRYFKKKGLNIICNDINDFSYVLGKAYIDVCEVPKFSILYKKNKHFISKINTLKKNGFLKEKIEKLIVENKNTCDQNFMDLNMNSKYFEVIAYLTYFADELDCGDINYGLFINNYCETGCNARYVNLVYKKTLDKIYNSSANKDVKKIIESFLTYPFNEKELDNLYNLLLSCNEFVMASKIKRIIDKGNVVGKRMFFSLEHGRRLDIIYNTISFWKINGYISESEYNILLTSIIESVCIFSNTSATYQAFYKDYRANTLQDFRMIIPEIDDTKIKSRVMQEDAYSIIPKIKADVMYLDPPYNWRQYDSNYHLLNTISKYYGILNKKEFDSQIVGASGENRIQKLEYTSFNKKSTFEETLLTPLSLSKCKVIALSYSDSESNHKRENIDDTLNLIDSFFSNKKIFNSYKVVKIKSHNFESRRGNKKEEINELLYIGIKK